MVQTLDLTRRTYGWTGAANASPSTQRDNGMIVRTNYVGNPSFEVNADNIGFGPAFSREWSAENALFGTRSLKLTRNTSQPGNGYSVMNVSGLTAGTQYVLSFYFAGGTAGAIYDTKGAAGLASGDRVYWVAGQEPWHRVVMPFVPSGSSVDFYLLTDDASSFVQGSVMYVDGVMVEEGTTPGRWFSGSSTPEALVGGDVVPLTSTLSTLNGSTVPLMLIQFAGARTAQHVIHEILGRSDPDVTFMPTQTRAGTLTFLYESLDAVAAARDLLALPGPVTLTQADMPALSMTFVVTGDLEVAPDQQDPYLWTIAVPFREAVA